MSDSGGSITGADASDVDCDYGVVVAFPCICACAIPVRRVAMV
jgi:hypothetical protein